MYLHKELKNSEFDIIGAFTRTYWTLGVGIHWKLITKKDCPELGTNLFVFDVNVLCFILSFNYWWKS